ncbi:hypothetical protein ABFT23_04785 [Nocardioides sp. C4-1]|uniref:hypothetical protein n=1 Tax=Nocardioides sp. C4-1 TaxID=3151851 RepID=UPI0032667A8C
MIAAPRSRSRAVPALAVLTLGLLMAACGSHPDEPQVASLPETALPAPTTTGPGAAPSAADPAGPVEGQAAGTDERPVFRVDDTEQRRRQVWNAYNACLLGHGATEPQGEMGVGLGDSLVDYANAPRSALEACAHLEPRQPPALDAATNPDFRQDTQAYVACLAGRGLFVTLLGDDSPDWTYTEGHPVPDDSAQIEQDCLVEAYGAG